MLCHDCAAVSGEKEEKEAEWAAKFTSTVQINSTPRSIAEQQRLRLAD